MGDISATVIFCDDVRHEIGGKTSIIGMYRGMLGMPQHVPALPRFVALVLLQYVRARQGQPIRVRLLDRGASLLEADFELPVGPEKPAESLIAGAAEWVELNMPLEVVGFAPEHGALLRVQIDIEGWHFESEPLLVLRQPAAAVAG